MQEAEGRMKPTLGAKGWVTQGATGVDQTHPRGRGPESNTHNEQNVGIKPTEGAEGENQKTKPKQGIRGWE